MSPARHEIPSDIILLGVYGLFLLDEIQRRHDRLREDAKIREERALMYQEKLDTLLKDARSAKKRAQRYFSEGQQQLPEEGRLLRIQDEDPRTRRSP